MPRWVNANEQLGNCKVNETTGVIMEIRFQEPPSDLNCNSGGSKKAGQNVKPAHGGSQQFRNYKNWMALNCKVAGSDSDTTFCVHGPNNPPKISGTNILVSGIPTAINCTINGVYPAPRIEWYVGTENIIMNATLHTASDNNTSLFNATSSLSFTPKLEDDGRLLTCRVVPFVPNVWTPSNTSIELNVIDESDISAVVEVEAATSSSLYISWQFPQGNMAGSSMLTLRYCQNTTGDLDNVETLDNLICPSYKEVLGLNGTSYNLTGLDPFEWYALALLAHGNTVASKIVSSARVYMTFSPEKEILEISRLPIMNRTVPSDLCFAIIQTESSTPNCSSLSLKCVDLGSKIDYYKEEDIPGIGLVSRGRGLCSQPTLYTPIILKSPGGMMDMPHVSTVMGAVIGISVSVLLSSVALLLFLNFICKGIGCLGNKGMNIVEADRNVAQRNAEHQYEDLQNRDVSGTGYMSMRPISSTVAPTNNSDDYMEYETIPSGAEECPALLPKDTDEYSYVNTGQRSTLTDVSGTGYMSMRPMSSTVAATNNSDDHMEYETLTSVAEDCPALLSKATECSYVNTGQRSTLTNKKQDAASSWEDAVTYF